VLRHCHETERLRSRGSVPNHFGQPETWCSASFSSDCAEGCFMALAWSHSLHCLPADLNRQAFRRAADDWVRAQTKLDTKQLSSLAVIGGGVTINRAQEHHELAEEPSSMMGASASAEQN
jgi:hypothetical protein